MRLTLQTPHRPNNSRYKPTDTGSDTSGYTMNLETSFMELDVNSMKNEFDKIRQDQREGTQAIMDILNKPPIRGAKPDGKK